MLPKIEYPLHTIEVPSLKKKFNFRPFLTKEEKLLLMAKESGNPSDYLVATKQVINNCSIDKKFQIDKLAIFDLEFLFLRLVAISIDNICKQSYIDNEDKKTYNFEIDLNKVEVKFPDKIDNNIAINDKIGIIMKYPPATLYNDPEFLSLEKDYMFELILKCLDKIYENDTIYDCSKYSKKDLEVFLDNLPVKIFSKINEFIINTPKIYHKITYTNTNGKEVVIELSSLSDFFV